MGKLQKEVSGKILAFYSNLNANNLNTKKYNVGHL
jgi:hypothetical protein